MKSVIKLWKVVQGIKILLKMRKGAQTSKQDMESELKISWLDF